MNLEEITDKGEIAVLIVEQERSLQNVQQNLQNLNIRYNQLLMQEQSGVPDEDKALDNKTNLDEDNQE